MPLSSLILSRDSQEVSVFECILGALGIDVEVETDPSLAWIRLKKSKVDAVIVDCDLAGAEAFLRRLQAEPDAAPVIIVSGSGDRSGLEAMGTEFVARKPVSVELAVHTFSAARNLLLQGRLRYHRQDLETPVSITRTKNRIKADLLNLSQRGMRVHMRQPQPLEGDVEIHFLLPGTQLAMEAKGEVAWTDTRGNAGIRLMDLSEPAKRDLQLWIERQYFHAGGD